MRDKVGGGGREEGGKKLLRDSRDREGEKQSTYNDSLEIDLRPA